ncbi:ABC transporter ATP-binding protein [Caldalkalibacillus mannanilyticus]|uniref:ABC transporter ATP-binding protein n=1 Tax=Caldalkalibacillus mannanilyticus TaxID=1418 RepID=UPI00046A0670|nr:ABC transporter ATP-binding protein [Caldalkalibacillus mannanilyticus]
MELIVQEVSKSYHSMIALHPTSFRVAKGEFISLLGPSGCGKTTLLRILSGLEEAESGEIRLDEQMIFSKRANKNVPTTERGMGMVFQDFALWPHMTVFENVAFGLRATRKTQHLKEKVEWALQKVRLQGLKDRFPHQLSGGQQQRVSFARAIVTEPRLILLDEPLSALDAMLREELRSELVTLVKELQFTALYVTHDQGEAMSMSDRIFLMNEGRILQEGSPEELYNQPNHPFVAQFIGKSNFITQTSFFRPEKISFHQKSIDDYVYQGVIEQILYQGDRYEVYVRVQNYQWTMYFAERPQVGETISFYLHPQDIIELTHLNREDETNEKIRIAL